MSKYRVCPTCSGEGKVVHPAFSVWTSADIEADPFAFHAMLEGCFNVPCPECLGLRVVDLKREDEYLEERLDHKVHLMEQGIYPGSPDWY